MTRTVPEWIGKTDDTNPPPRVRQRVFDRDNGICHVCELAIKPGESWHADHVKALIEGGENRETNLAPTHGHCNLKKATEENKRKAKVQRVKEKASGARKPKGKIQSRGFDKQERKAKPALPPRQLYRSAP